MGQLIYNKDFTGIIEEYKYWKNKEEIPKKINDYIEKNNQELVIDDFTYKYCGKCLNKLENNKCSKCEKEYKQIENDKYNLYSFDNKIENYIGNITYYIFDREEVNIYLYEITEEIKYKKIINWKREINYIRDEEININKIYKVLDKGLLEIKENQFIEYKNIEVEEDTFENKFLYVDNLEELEKVNIYKYSKIWEIKEELEKRKINILTITYNPICCKEFEYLVKLGLNNLALDNKLEKIKYKKNFEKTFGISKQYYQIMKKMNIDYEELEALRLVPTEDEELIRFGAKYYSIIKELKDKYKLKIDKIYNYLKIKKLESYNILEYSDYIEYCEKLQLDLNNKKVLYPDNLLIEHDKLETWITISKNPDIDKKIKQIANVLELNIYEDEKYIIFPAIDVKSLIDESRQMVNCVRTYYNKITDKVSQIYFMRYKKSKDVSLVTIEVQQGKVVQARGKYNNNPSDEELRVIKKWEKEGMYVIYE